MESRVPEADPLHGPADEKAESLGASGNKDAGPFREAVGPSFWERG